MLAGFALAFPCPQHPEAFSEALHKSCSVPHQLAQTPRAPAHSSPLASVRGRNLGQSTSTRPMGNLPLLLQKAEARTTRLTLRCSWGVRLGSEQRFDFLHIGMSNACVCEFFEIIEDDLAKGSLAVGEFGIFVFQINGFCFVEL